MKNMHKIDNICSILRNTHTIHTIFTVMKYSNRCHSLSVLNKSVTLYIDGKDIS